MRKSSLQFINSAYDHLNCSLHGLESYEGSPVEEILSAIRSAFDKLVELVIDYAIRRAMSIGELYQTILDSPRGNPPYSTHGGD